MLLPGSHSHARTKRAYIHPDSIFRCVARICLELEHFERKTFLGLVRPKASQACRFYKRSFVRSFTRFVSARLFRSCRSRKQAKSEHTFIMIHKRVRNVRLRNVRLIKCCCCSSAPLHIVYGARNCRSTTSVHHDKLGRPTLGSPVVPILSRPTTCILLVWSLTCVYTDIVDNNLYHVCASSADEDC